MNYRTNDLSLRARLSSLLPRLFQRACSLYRRILYLPCETMESTNKKIQGINPPPPLPLFRISTYVCRLSVIIHVTCVTSQSEVSNFHDVIFTNKDIPRCQISVNTLRKSMRNELNNFATNMRRSQA